MGCVMKRLAASFIFILFASLSVVSSASAISADLAKECRAMAFKAHPPTPPGAKAGSAGAERDFYRACITNNDSTTDNDTKRTTDPSEK